jgi:hypothetical protein
MLEMMRANVTLYAHWLNYFAPCIVSVKRWNDFKASTTRMQNGEDILDEFLTVSDEAFMLLVLINYGARWTAEFQATTNNKVRQPCIDSIVAMIEHVD